MVKNFDDLQQVGKENVDVTLRAMGALSKGTQAIAVEVADYSKKAFEDSTAAIEKYDFGSDGPAELTIIQLPAGTERIASYVVNGSGTLPRRRKPAMPAGSRVCETAPLARSAFTCDAARTVIPSFA